MTETVRVFLNYRREDSRHVAARIGDRLGERFQLFMDIDRIRPGMDFSAVVRDAVGASDVLLAVIGDRWLTVADAHGRPRLEDPADWVAVEIGAALQRGKAVIPVLVDEARMPTAADLPASLAPLTLRHGMRVRHESFVADCDLLVKAVLDLAGRGTDSAVEDDPEYASALVAYFESDWKKAVALLERVVARHPQHRQAAQRLTKARRELQLAELSGRADAAARAGDWASAVVALEELQKLGSEDPALPARLAVSLRNAAITGLQADIRMLAATGQWAALLRADAEVAALEPQAADIEGLATRARHELGRAQAASLYATAVTHLDEGRWDQAAEVLSGLVAQYPGYHDADRLLAIARQRMRPAAPNPSPPADSTSWTPQPAWSPQPDPPTQPTGWPQPSGAPASETSTAGQRTSRLDYLMIAVAAVAVLFLVLSAVMVVGGYPSS